MAPVTAMRYNESDNPYFANLRGRKPTSKFYLESFPGSDCQVSFEGVLHIEGHLAGNIRSFNGTLVMPEQVKIEADIEVGVALINGSVIGEHHPEPAGRAPAPGPSRREYQYALSVHQRRRICKEECVFEDVNETGAPAAMRKDGFLRSKSHGRLIFGSEPARIPDQDDLRRSSMGKSTLESPALHFHYKTGHW